MKILQYGNLYPQSRYILAINRYVHYSIDENEENLKILEELGYNKGDFIRFRDGDGRDRQSKKMLKEFLDVFRKKSVEKTIGKAPSDASATYDEGIDLLSDDAEFLGEKKFFEGVDWANVFRSNFIMQKQNDPSFVYKLFVAAKTNPKYYAKYGDITPEKSQQRKAIFADMINEFAAEGGDI